MMPKTYARVRPLPVPRHPARPSIAGVYAGECAMANVPAVWLLRVSHWVLEGRNDCSAALNHEASLLADRLDPYDAFTIPAEFEPDAPEHAPVGWRG